MLNPFNTERIARELIQASFVKIGKLDLDESHSTDGGTNHVAPSQNLFMALKAPFVKKVKGERHSVVMSENDMSETIAAFEHSVHGQVLLTWSFIPIPLSVVAFPLVSNIESVELASAIALGPFVAVAILLQVLSQTAFWRSRKALKKLADEYWKRELSVVVPKHLKHAYLKSNFRIMSGPIAAYILDEGVDLVPNEQAKLAYKTFSLGKEIINPLLDQKNRNRDSDI